LDAGVEPGLIARHQGDGEALGAELLGDGGGYAGSEPDDEEDLGHGPQT
jgi:hypothetical protein